MRGEAPGEVVRDFEQVVANMQLAYADAVKQEERPAPKPAPEAAPEPEELPEIDPEELGGEGG
jgi:hypothetical protein